MKEYKPSPRPEHVEGLMKQLEITSGQLAEVIGDIHLMTRMASINKIESIADTLHSAAHETEHVEKHCVEIRRALILLYPK